MAELRLHQPRLSSVAIEQRGILADVRGLRVRLHAAKARVWNQSPMVWAAHEDHWLARGITPKSARARVLARGRLLGKTSGVFVVRQVNEDEAAGLAKSNQLGVHDQCALAYDVTRLDGRDKVRRHAIFGINCPDGRQLYSFTVRKPGEDVRPSEDFDHLVLLLQATSLDRLNTFTPTAWDCKELGAAKKVSGNDYADRVGILAAAGHHVQAAFLATQRARDVARYEPRTRHGPEPLHLPTRPARQRRA